MAIFLRYVFLCSLAATLSACGGGGGDDTQPLAEASDADPSSDPTTVDIATNDPDTNGPTVVEDTTSDVPVVDEPVVDDTVAEEPVTDDTTTTEFPVFATPAGVAQCSTEDINLRVDFDMRDYYIFYDQVPNLNLANFDAPEELIRELRVAPDIFSNVQDAVDQNALNVSGASGGFGFVFEFAADDVVRVREILVGSPADQAGLLRGDELLAVNNIVLSEITDEQVNTAFDPDNAPINLLVQTGDNIPREVSVNFEDFRWVTAGPSTRFSSTNPDVDLPVVGYLPIRRFLETTQDEIDAELDALAAAGGFDELIIDLRYNPGGRVSVARHIASIIGGAAVQNEAFLLSEFNDKYSIFNTEDIFDVPAVPLSLPRVFVLVTGRSASSSEIFINSLEPFIDVVVLGQPTGGKPFISFAQEYCGKSINAMAAVNTNAVGVSVSGGILPDCPITDDWGTQADSVADPLVGGALDFVLSGSCGLVAETAAPPRATFGQGLSYQDPEMFVPEM